jgi:hypothetical protein
MFDWLKTEAATVRTRKYFVFEAAGDVLSASEWSDLPRSYRQFAAEFGAASLYREGVGYVLCVLVPPVAEVLERGDERVFRIGYFDGRHAYFRVAELKRGAEAPVYEGTRGFLTRVSGFADWLQRRAALVRKRLGKRRWAAIVKGPPPFSAEETSILRARDAFQWRDRGRAEDGAVVVEVTNRSTRTIPCLTIGVRSRGGELSGAYAFPVEGVLPGETRLIRRVCYKGLIAPEDIELFSLPEALPEDRERYWELRV